MTKATKPVEQLREIYKQVEKQAIEDYIKFLQFQSVSSESDYKEQVHACANWVANFLKTAGFETEIWATDLHPILFASYDKAGPDKPTLLIYNHYDVQPVDPIDQWLSPPFEPTIRDGQVYARGAQDNKGQCFYTMLALKTLLQKQKRLPVNVKLCIEGEEECGSLSLSKILPNKKQQLKADYLAIVDMGLPEANVPAVTLGVRGIVTMEVTAEATNTDLHSGWGGAAYNPLRALVELLSKVYREDGLIAIPGFYDDVVPLTSEERSLVSLDLDEKKYEALFGAKPTGGEKNLPLGERVWTRPMVEINGISGGYAGTGFKTVIPARALAKVSCRLVPDQNPDKIAPQVANFFLRNAPKGVKIKVELFPGGGKAIRANPSSHIVKAFSQAYEEVFGSPCQRVYSGGSIPIVTELAEASGGEVILMGLGLPDDKIHAPNEHFGLDRIEKGFLIIARTLEILNPS